MWWPSASCTRAHGPRAAERSLAGFLTLAALIAAAFYGGPKHVLMVLAAAAAGDLPVRPAAPAPRLHVSWAIAATLFGVLWIGMHGAGLARCCAKLGRHGEGLMVDVLVATFLGDMAAVLRRPPLRPPPAGPLISPGKTLEGLIAGIVGGTLAFWFAGLYQDWLSGPDALLIGLFVAIAAPVGDLFESLIKRDLEVKDTGRLLGPHGGVLDRLDAAFFTVVVGYYAAVGLGYG